MEKSLSNILISIVTPTYNRGYIMPKLFESLTLQKKINFEWIIVDDGSTDNTSKVVKKFKTKKFNICYIYKEHEGKCKSLNFSHPYINGKLTFIVDSDDRLAPDATLLIENIYKKYKCNTNIKCYSFQRQSNSGEILCIDSHYADFYCLSTHFDYRINDRFTGDRAEIVFSDVFKKFPFPVNPSEKFFSEGWLFARLSEKYLTLYINTPIYICEYLAGGLSDNYFKNCYENPHNMMSYFSAFLNSKVKKILRIKCLANIVAYGIIAREHIMKISRMYRIPVVYILLIFPLALFVFIRKKRQYDRSQVES